MDYPTIYLQKPWNIITTYHGSKSWAHIQTLGCLDMTQQCRSPRCNDQYC